MILVLTFAGCSRDGRPDEQRAKADFQRLLDGVSYAGWRVNRVTRTNGRMTTRSGTHAYVMDADVDVTVLKAVSGRDTVARGLKMFVDIWNGKTWLLDLVGRSGDRRVVSMQLLFIQKDKGWELVGPCSDCGS
jgi:hypothetical protein